MKKNQTYDEAFAALQMLVAQIEDENIPLDTLAKKVADANALIKYCDEKLRKIEADIAKK